ncbi:DUF4157 domain-containing protein [Paraburkholderia sp. GAS334]|uniref:eCIS core domain-containing protein n=1 Tax=Paraburkholderia sp. GAS334 TaxID=3035131 RepID=UPI003D1C2FBA
MSDRDGFDRPLSTMLIERRSDAWKSGVHPLDRLEDGALVSRDRVDNVACRIGDASCASAHARVLNRSKRSVDLSMQRSLLRLQMRYGNRYVGQVLHRVAGGGEAGNDMDGIEHSIDAARSSGRAMDHGTRTRMETAFGADFSGVRLHTDAHADGLSRSLSARAFTTGRDVFFRHGEYSPGTSSGRELLAHELTHVVQQNGDGLQRKMTVSEPGDAQEIEADQMARAVIAQEHAQTTHREAIRRDPEEGRLAGKATGDTLLRQPEAAHEDDEEKKRLHTKADTAVASPSGRRIVA